MGKKNGKMAWAGLCCMAGWLAAFPGTAAEQPNVPFIARWPGHVAAGSTSSQTICLVDFFTTLGDLLGAPLPAHAAEDSVSFLPALSGKPIVSTRAGIVHHSWK